MRRPGNDEISIWSNMNCGARLRGVTIGISSRLQPSVVEVTKIDECVMQVRLKHTLGFVSCWMQCTFLQICVRLLRRCFMPNLNLHWTNAPPGTFLLSWATLVLTQALKELDTIYVLVPITLVLGTPIAFSWMLQTPEDWELHILVITDQGCTAKLGIALTAEGWELHILVIRDQGCTVRLGIALTVG